MARNTIALKGDFIRKEGKASAAVTPGHLVEFGGANDLRVHSTVGGQARKAFALENDLIGKTIADAYALAETVHYGVFQPGAEVNAIVNYAAQKGDFLESNGDGRLKLSSTPIEGSNIAVAMETVAGAGSCRVEVL